MSVTPSPTYAGIEVREFTIGRVVGDSFRIFGQHFFKIWLIGLLPAIVALPNVMLAGLQSSNSMGGGLGPASIAVTVAMVVAMVALTYVAFGIITTGTVQSLATGAFGLNQAVGLGFGRVLPLVVVAIVMMVAVGLGLVLLIVPGIYLALRYWVAASATVIEQRGPFDSMRRSADLTSGRRWTILGVLVVTGLIFAVLTVAVGAFVALVIGIDPLTGQNVLAGDIITAVVSAALNGFWPVLSGVSYYLLRVEKEGPDVHKLADVFA